MMCLHKPGTGLLPICSGLVTWIVLGTTLMLAASEIHAQNKSATPEKRAMSELEVSCAQVKQMLDDNEKFLLLDCREEDEYETVHIEGSKLMPMSEIVRKVGQIDEHREKPVVVYCHHGGRSLRVTKFLIDQGFTNVKSMAGGIDEWSETIDPSKPRY